MNTKCIEHTIQTGLWYLIGSLPPDLIRIYRRSVKVGSGRLVTGMNLECMLLRRFA